jgi:type IV pilus assembly protein PilZ
MTTSDNTAQTLPLIKVNFTNVNTLYKAYMPYLQNAGIFIAESQNLQLGDRVQLQITLPGDLEKNSSPVDASVAWVTPQGAQGRWISGLGLEFSSKENSRRLREKINLLLLENSEKDAPTSTM